MKIKRRNSWSRRRSTNLNTSRWRIRYRSLRRSERRFKRQMIRKLLRLRSNRMPLRTRNTRRLLRKQRTLLNRSMMMLRSRKMIRKWWIMLTLSTSRKRKIQKMRRIRKTHSVQLRKWLKWPKPTTSKALRTPMIRWLWNLLRITRLNWMIIRQQQSCCLRDLPILRRNWARMPMHLKLVFHRKRLRLQLFQQSNKMLKKIPRTQQVVQLIHQWKKIAAS